MGFNKTKLVHMPLGGPVIINGLSYSLSNLTLIVLDSLKVEDSYRSFMRELKQVTFSSHRLKLEVNNSHVMM